MPGRQQGTPLAYDGVLYMPNPNDVIQAIDAVTGDLLWSTAARIPTTCVSGCSPACVRRTGTWPSNEHLIIDTSVDEYVFALDARTGELVWETQILDYRTHPANQSSGPIVATGRSSPAGAACPRAAPTPASSRPTTP